MLFEVEEVFEFLSVTLFFNGIESNLLSNIIRTYIKYEIKKLLSHIHLKSHYHIDLKTSAVQLKNSMYFHEYSKNTLKLEQYGTLPD